MNKPKAMILDMDGTLCDVREIRYHINPKDPNFIFPGRKRFDQFHRESVNCPANEDALEHYRRAKEEGLAIIIVTARKFEWLYQTMYWLSEHGVEYEELCMRANSDHRKDVHVKSDILDEIEQKYEVVEAVDDNPSIIKLWKSRGIKTHIIEGWET